MVDFCLYLNPTDSPALQALGRRTPTLTVNHTDFAPLQLSPIVLSIETKRPGKELDAAQLQMGVWHAAQWAFLRSVIGLTPEPVTAEDEILRNQKANEVLGQLGFIPGIIVQGHRWLFVFSTLEGDKTVLWTERQFGTTQSILDTYAVVAGIRELARWARDVYVPWFRANVLAGFQPQFEYPFKVTSEMMHAHTDVRPGLESIYPEVGVQQHDKATKQSHTFSEGAPTTRSDLVNHEAAQYG